MAYQSSLDVVGSATATIDGCSTGSLPTWTSSSSAAFFTFADKTLDLKSASNFIVYEYRDDEITK